MKRRKIVIIVIIAAAAAALCFMLWDKQSVFNGEKVKNPDSYTLKFEIMNQDDSHTLVLRQGDALSVDFAVDRGRVDLVIGVPSEKAIYRGNSIESGVFELTVPEDGEYRIDVSARHASGFIMIYTHAKGN